MGRCNSGRKSAGLIRPSIHFLQQADGDDGGLNGALAQQIEQGIGRETGKAQVEIAIGPHTGIAERLIAGQIAAEGLRIDGAQRFCPSAPAAS